MGQLILYNKPLIKKLRQDLRKKQTESEARLWHYLRGRKLDGYKFYRQYSIGNYVADFYCPKKRIAIELDGSVHNNKLTRINDKVRTATFESVNVMVIRFWNAQVLNDTERVVKQLHHLLLE